MRRRDQLELVIEWRPRDAQAALSVRVFTMLVMEPGGLVMERKMLLGIKQRAEDLARYGDQVRAPRISDESAR